MKGPGRLEGGKAGPCPLIIRGRPWRAPAYRSAKKTPLAESGKVCDDANAAGVVELVDAPDSKSGSERSAGSTPAARTNSLLAYRAFALLEA